METAHLNIVVVYHLRHQTLLGVEANSDQSIVWICPYHLILAWHATMAKGTSKNRGFVVLVIFMALIYQRVTE